MGKIITIEFAPNVDYSLQTKLQLDKKYCNIVGSLMQSYSLRVLSGADFDPLFSSRYVKPESISGMTDFIVGAAMMIDRFKAITRENENVNNLSFSYIRSYAMRVIQLNGSLNIMEPEEFEKSYYYISALESVLNLHFAPIDLAILVANKFDERDAIASLEIGGSTATILDPSEMSESDIINSITLLLEQVFSQD